MKSSVALFICLLSLTVAAQQPAPTKAPAPTALRPRRPLRLRRPSHPRRLSIRNKAGSR